jgi:para-nitrobenzyl esterase
MKLMPKFFIISAVLAGAMLLPACKSGSGSGAACEGPEEQQLFIGDNIAVANTEYGRVRGYILGEIYTFLGVPYGAPVDGENRFMRAQKPQPWEDIRPAVFYGNVAPQITDNKWPNGYGTFTDHWNYHDVSENCLTLNVWTPNLDEAKRPVIVWFHGGGFTNGNAIEQDGYHGENFARFGDVVFVSVNHRLGPIGFTDFSAVDPKFKDSGNVGILDCVDALKWVHNNIASFGGDPDNVTIIGQSGGGAKVCNLIQMPETAGLISKGVALSGNTISAIDPGYSQELGKFIYEKAGKSMEKLQSMTWREYIDLANASYREFNAIRPTTGFRRGFGPVADGTHIPAGTFFSDPAAASAKVPLLLCSTTSESAPSKTNAALEEVDRAGAIEILKSMRGFGGAVTNPEAAFDAYMEVFPDQKPIDAVGLIFSSRAGVVNTANAKHVQEAPVYVAWFGMNSPLFDGRMRAPHCADICYWFMNTDRMVTHTGGGARPRNLSKKMAGALLAFMRTGNPNVKGLPEWPEYTPENGELMFLGDECKVMNDPDREARKSLEN